MLNERMIGLKISSCYRLFVA